MKKKIAILAVVGVILYLVLSAASTKLFPSLYTVVKEAPALTLSNK